MLITLTKVIDLHGQQVKLYSLDNGRTWVSRPHDLIELRRRRTSDIHYLQFMFRKHGGERLAWPVPSGDYWSR